MHSCMARRLEDGIGVAALRAGTRVLGGELDVSSVTGVGTVRMKFPIDAAFGEARFAIAS
jgi:hypothetical protein